MPSKTWFTSDLHLGHERIISLSGRPFATVEEMNEKIIERYNAVVGDDDVVWFLGDVAMGRIAETLPMLGQLKGKKYLKTGNHDRCDALYDDNEPRRERWKKAYIEQGGFKAVMTGATYLNATSWRDRAPLGLPLLGGQALGGKNVLLSHYPYAGEPDAVKPDRYKKARPDRPKPEKDKPLPWLLHGHVHGAWCVRDRMINVGVDVWDFAPVEAETLVALIEGGPQ